MTEQFKQFLLEKSIQLCKEGFITNSAGYKLTPFIPDVITMFNTLYHTSMFSDRKVICDYLEEVGTVNESEVSPEYDLSIDNYQEPAKENKVNIEIMSNEDEIRISFESQDDRMTDTGTRGCGFTYKTKEAAKEHMLRYVERLFK